MYEYKCKIVKIVDDDTIDVDIDLIFGTWIHNERIRLVSFIDTIESRTRDLEEKKLVCTLKSVWKDSYPCIFNSNINNT